MVKRFSRLQRIDNKRKITKETDYEFWYQLQRALLLALREQGRLTPMQHRHAEEHLKKQRRDRAKRKQEEP